MMAAEESDNDNPSHENARGQHSKKLRRNVVLDQDEDDLNEALGSHENDSKPATLPCGVALSLFCLDQDNYQDEEEDEVVEDRNVNQESDLDDIDKQMGNGVSVAFRTSSLCKHADTP